MDPDVEIVLDYYKHLFPNFSIPHATVYKFLWRVEPLPVEKIVEETGLGKTKVYQALRDLTIAGLVNRTNFSPPAYYASDPIKTYSTHFKKIATKLEKGLDKLETILENSSGLSGELYLVKKDGGQQKLLLKNTREDLDEVQQLLLIKKTAEEQLKQIEKQKLKQCAFYK